MLQLSTKTREPKNKLGTSRLDGLVPAVLYGPEREAASVSVIAGEFNRLYAKAGASTLVELSVEGEKEPVIVVIREVQRHPVKGSPMHVDFMAVKMGEEMTVAVPLVFVGEAPIEKAGEGVVVTEIRDLEISALPKDLPSGIEVDISVLDSTSAAITVADLKLPEGVRATGDMEQIVVNATALMKEEVIEEGPPEGEAVAEGDEDATTEGDADTSDKKSSEEEGDES